jgi:hypothetical protein
MSTNEAKGISIWYQVGPRGNVYWFAYPNGIPGGMLRDKRGFGRRFKSQRAADAAIVKAKAGAA